MFRYLHRAELLACMTVCKAWYKWYVQPQTAALLMRSIVRVRDEDKLLSRAGAATSVCGATST